MWFCSLLQGNKIIKLLFVLNIQNRNDVAMFFMFPWYTFFLAKLGTVRPTRFLLAKWQTPKQIVFFLRPQFALRQLPYSGIERSLLNSCNLVLNTTSRLCAWVYFSTPASLVAGTYYTRARLLVQSACRSGKRGSDAVGQAEARLAGGRGLNVPHNKFTVNFRYISHSIYLLSY